MVKRSGLGRGLDSLFSSNEPVVSNGDITRLRLMDVEPKSDQPRQVFDEESLQLLSISIKEHGVIQPIAVRKIDGGRYQIIAGERRWRASKLAGVDDIPAIILDADDLKTAKLALIENIQRENLNPIEEAMAYKSLADTYGLTQEEIASEVAKSRSAVTNILRLLDLPDYTAKLLTDGKLSSGHCRALLGLSDKSKINELADVVVEKTLSVRQTEILVKSANKSKKNESQDNKIKIDYTAELEKKVRDLSGRYCKISNNGRKKTVSFEYTSEDDLEEILSLICKKNISED